MVVHMIRLLTESPAGLTVEEVNAEVQMWVDSHAEWFADSVSHEVIEVRVGDISDDLLGTVYLRGDFRFEWDAQTATELLDSLEAQLMGSVAWWRIGYHSCHHDESNPQGCAWDQEREFGIIPLDIPNLLS